MSIAKSEHIPRAGRTLASWFLQRHIQTVAKSVLYRIHAFYYISFMLRVECLQFM